ncbi:anaerobic ribonucleoside-triphosphate reductase [Candidatus Pyrohabitans sp.]
MGVTATRIRVVKASGETEAFDPNMVTNDCVDAGIDFWTAIEVAQEVSKRIKDGVSTREIQQETLRVLYAKNPEAAERYKRFHSMYVRTSRNTIEAFDRKKIVASLIRETSLPREIAENIAREAEAELRRLKLDFISAPLIREVVNVKLLEHGFEEARANYTRLGMPVYDASRLVEGEARTPEAVHRAMAANVLREFTLLKVLPLTLADAHMRGGFHIHALEAFATKASAFAHDLRNYLLGGVKGGSCTSPPADSATEAVLTAIKVLRLGEGSFSTSQCLDHINVWLAPYVSGMGSAEIAHTANLLLYEVSQLGAGEHSYEMGVEYGIPEFLASQPAVLPGGVVEEGTTYADFEEEARALAVAMAEAFAAGDYLAKPFLYPKVYFKLRDEYEGREGYDAYLQAAHLASARGANHCFVAPPEDGLQIANYTFPDEEAANWLCAGMMQVVTLNLPRITYLSDGSEKKLFGLLEERMNLARDVLLVKKEMTERRMISGMPFLSENYSGARIQLGIGYVGLNEMLSAFLGRELHEDDATKLGLRVVKYMHNLVEQFSRESGLSFVLTQAEDENPAMRLAKLDHGLFADKLVARGSRRDGSVYYTHASQVRVDADVPLNRRLSIEGEFHPLCRGGAISRILLSEVQPEATALAELSRRIATRTKLRFWSYAPESSYCRKCGGVVPARDNCTFCGSTLGRLD